MESSAGRQMAARRREWTISSPRRGISLFLKWNACAIGGQNTSESFQRFSDRRNQEWRGSLLLNREENYKQGRHHHQQAQDNDQRHVLRQVRGLLSLRWHGWRMRRSRPLISRGGNVLRNGGRRD